jgi:hypothetical protein
MKPNPFYNYAAYISGFRDSVFYDAIARAARYKPEDRHLGIIELGGIRDLSKHSRFSDGWSTMIFVQAIEKLKIQGFITVCDLDNLTSIYSALFDTPWFSNLGGGVRVSADDEPLIQIDLWRDKGAKFLDAIAYASNTDLFLLDGSNDPRETKDQFEWARESNPNAVIVIDDWTIKGALLKEVYALRSAEYWTEHVIPYEYDGIKGVHYMATFDPRRSDTSELALK